MRPILCNYYVSLRCNSRCKFCNIWQLDDKMQEQTIEQVKSNLVDLKKLGVKLIDFTGGEPLLYSNLTEVLVLAKDLGFYTTVTTNCLLYPKHGERLKGLVDSLQFSILSTNEERHNNAAGVKSFEKVLESIELAKKLNEKVSLNFTLTDENYFELEEMVEFAQKRRVILSVNPCFEYFGNKGVSKSTIEKAGQYFNAPFVVMDLANHHLIKNSGNNRANPVCKAISSTIVISPDNYLLLPCYHKSFKKIKINENLYEIYNSDEVLSLKKQEGRFDFCEGCTIYCYMRSSFYRKVFSKYFWLSLTSGINYLQERSRKQA